MIDDNSPRALEFCLKDLLKEKKMSVRQCAALAGIHYKTALNIYHNATRGVSLDVLSRICSTLDVDPGALFKVKGDDARTHDVKDREKLRKRAA